MVEHVTTRHPLPPRPEKEISKKRPLKIYYLDINSWLGIKSFRVYKRIRKYF